MYARQEHERVTVDRQATPLAPLTPQQISRFKQDRVDATRVSTLGSLDSTETGSSYPHASVASDDPVSARESPDTCRELDLQEVFGAPGTTAAWQPLAPEKPMDVREEQYRRPMASFLRESQASSSNSKDSVAQNWFRRCLEDLTPTDFHPDGVAIYTTAHLQAPDQFQDVCFAISDKYISGVLPAEELPLVSTVSVVLIFCDIRDDCEVQRALNLNECVSNLGQAAPPILLLPHSPEQPLDDMQSRSLANSADREFEILANLMTVGIDCVVIGGQEVLQGRRLAAEVRTEILKQESRVAFFNRSINAHREKVQKAMELEESVEDSVWDYLRFRLSTSIPPADHTLGPCRPGAVFGNSRVLKQLGEGGSGQVYALQDYAQELGPEASPKVLKVLHKKGKTSCIGIKTIDNEIKVMEELSSSRWQHPSIIKLHQVFHTETQILLCMEDGGPLDLYKSLRMHEMKRSPLGYVKSKSIMNQCLAGICHLHLGPKVVHRDIKPENIIIREEGDVITAKISDFDLARRLPKPCLSSFIGGTFPFMAPDFFLGRPYNPFPTDVWSMGIVFLEVLTRCGILSKVLSFQRVARHDPAVKLKEKQMTLQIRDYFEKPDSVHRLLQLSHGPELEDVVNSPLADMIEGMLTTDVAERSNAEELQEFLTDRT
jgi:hypothetical protein